MSSAGEEASLAGRVRILHLEDSHLDAELVAMHLRLGQLVPEILRVDTRDGYEAALARGGHDVVLADYNVPGFDGLTALTLARARLPETPFVFVSGALGEETAIEAVRLGAADYVVKQRLSRLPNTVRRAIGEARAIAERRAAEARLIELNATLEARVAERTAELEEANRRLLAEAAERELAEARYEALYTRTPIPLHSLDGEGRLLSVSDRWLEFLEQPDRDAVIGRPITDFLTEAAAEAHRERHWPRLMAKGAFDDVEYAFRKRSGAVADVLVSARLSRDGRGNITRTMAALVDVTERRRAEKALRQAQKMEALGQLAGGVAHDFNNVLQAVAGGARLIARRPDDPAAVRRLAAMLIDAADRGASVARRLLGFTRRDELRAEAVDVADMLSNLREVLAHTLGPGARLELDLPDAALPALLADRLHLETVLINLATNARDALPAEGGRIALGAAVEEVAPGDAHPGALSPGIYLRLDVADSGQGMDAATLARASEPFFTTKPRGKGTGLGLAMAKGFAEHSGGALRIESAPGRGTTVTLWLPQAVDGVSFRPPRRASAGIAAANDVHGAAPVPANDLAGRLHVLVVDDEPLVRSVVAAELAERGHAVVVAEDAAAALARLAAGEQVDLLVTDLAMPGMDGLSLIREARGRRPGLAAVLLTGHAGDAASGLLAGAADAGPFTLLRKPVAPAELADAALAMLAAAD